MQPDEIVRRILEGRGIVSEEEISEFLSEKPKLIYDPLLLPGMEAGADFVLDKLSLGNHICVYGDYDVDGICGSALLILFIRKVAQAMGSSSEISFYIPARIEEGYGLNKGALKTILERGAEAVITVDCGSVSVDEVSYAREIGLDIMITDHHDPNLDSLPDCVHINPKLAGGYPFEKLAGAGVAFKLCRALLDRIAGESYAELRVYLNSLVDLVCVATIADVMPLVDENRTIVKYGLNALKKESRKAFRELLSVSGVKPEKLNVREVAFGLSPRINALGRLDHAADGVELFLTDDAKQIRETVLRMNELNMQRRQIQSECFDKCMELYRDDLDEEGTTRHMFLLLKPDGAYEGVAGIVAGKVREETGLPCAVLSATSDEKGYLKGSARSSGQLNLIDLLKNHSELFERFGGHFAAAGFVLKEENEERLKEALSDDVRAMLKEMPDLLDNAKIAELDIEMKDICYDLVEAVEKLAPFGNGNPKPLFGINVPIEEITNFSRLGKDGKHLKFKADGISFIKFGVSEKDFSDLETAIQTSEPKASIRILGCPEINEWNGNRYLQILVEQIEISGIF